MISKLAALDSSMFEKDGIELSGTAYQKRLLIQAIKEYKSFAPDNARITVSTEQATFSQIANIKAHRAWKKYVTDNPINESRFGKQPRTDQSQQKTSGQSQQKTSGQSQQKSTKDAFTKAAGDPKEAKGSKLEGIFELEDIVRLRQAYREIQIDFSDRSNNSIDNLLIRAFDRAIKTPKKGMGQIHMLTSKLNTVYGDNTYNTDTIVRTYKNKSQLRNNAA